MKTQHDVLHTFSQGMKFAGNIPPMPTSSLLREDLTAMVIAEDSMKRSGIPLAKASDAKLWEQKLTLHVNVLARNGFHLLPNSLQLGKFVDRLQQQMH